MSILLLNADASCIQLADESVHVVASHTGGVN